MTLSEGLTAVIDSGTSLIMGPAAQVEAIAIAFGSSNATMLENLYKIDCSKVATLPNIEFVMGQQAYSLDPSDYILDDGETCVMVLQGDPTSQVRYVTKGPSMMPLLMTADSSNTGTMDSR